jgi:hypothetical protein
VGKTLRELNKAANLFYNIGAQGKFKMETPTFLYKPNFCAECGEKIERERWHFWSSRRFCDECEPVYRLNRLLPPALAAAAVFFGGIFFGQMGQSPRKPRRYRQRRPHWPWKSPWLRRQSRRCRVKLRPRNSLYPVIHRQTTVPRSRLFARSRRSTQPSANRSIPAARERKKARPVRAGCGPPG